MTNNGNDKQWGIYRQWEVVVNGEYKNTYNWNDRQWGIKDKWKL